MVPVVHDTVGRDLAVPFPNIVIRAVFGQEKFHVQTPPKRMPTVSIPTGPLAIMYGLKLSIAANNIETIQVL